MSAGGRGRMSIQIDESLPFRAQVTLSDEKNKQQLDELNKFKIEISNKLMEIKNKNSAQKSPYKEQRNQNSHSKQIGHEPDKECAPTPLLYK